MLVVLEALGPRERLAFVLHDVFAIPFAQIARVLDRTPDASKQLASRARRKVRRFPTTTGTLAERRAVVDAFLSAARDGDFAQLIGLLDPQVVWCRRTPQGSAESIGPDELLASVRRGDLRRIEVRRVDIDGEPGLLVRTRTGRPLGIMACTVADGRMAGVVSIADPGRVARSALGGAADDG